MKDTMKIISRLNESKSPLIKTYNVTNYGEPSNFNLIYGELVDGNWYTFDPENDRLSIFNAPITSKFIDCIFNYGNDDLEPEDEHLRDDKWYDDFIDDHEIKNYENATELEDEIVNKYFNLDNEED